MGYNQEEYTPPSRTPGTSYEKGDFRSTALGIDCTISNVDIARFNAAMKALTESAGQAREEAMLHGVMSLAAALRAATKKAPKYRKLRVAYETRQKGKHTWRNPIWEREKYALGSPVWEFAGYRYDGKTKSKYVLARIVTREDAKERGRIWNSGMAKSAWFWFLSHVGYKGGKADFDPSVASFVDLSIRHDKKESVATLYNRLSYASLAFRSTGGKLPENAFARAAGIMEHYIYRQYQKYMRKFS